MLNRQKIKRIDNSKLLGNRIPAKQGETGLARPKKALITRETAVQAALEIIEENGLSDFSLGAVARKMDVKSPSLYHHFQHKEDLLEEVAREILSLARFAEDESADWETRTIQICLDTRKALLRYPNAAPLILQFFPRHLMLGAYERAVIGYPETRELHMAILEAIEKLGSPSMPAFDAKRYPNLAESMAANPYDDEQIFLEALRTLILGIRVRTDAMREDKPSIDTEYRGTDGRRARPTR